VNRGKREAGKGARGIVTVREGVASEPRQPWAAICVGIKSDSLRLR
jgi:hypothetical protein